MRKKIAIAVFASLAIPASAFASGWTQNDKATKVTTSQAGYTRITLAGTGVNPDSCTGGANSLYYLDTNHPDKETIVAIILTARASDQPLRFFLSGCYTSGGSTHPQIWSAEY